MKISILPSVNVVYLRIDHKLISILIINKRSRERVDWKESSYISKIIIKKIYISTVRKNLTKVVLHYT